MAISASLFTASEKVAVGLGFTASENGEYFLSNDQNVGYSRRFYEYRLEIDDKPNLLFLHIDT